MELIKSHKNPVHTSHTTSWRSHLRKFSNGFLATRFSIKNLLFYFYSFHDKCLEFWHGLHILLLSVISVQKISSEISSPKQLASLRWVIPVVVVRSQNHKICIRHAVIPGVLIQSQNHKPCIRHAVRPAVLIQSQHGCVLIACLIHIL
jgi:hypothetical protein